MRKPLHKLKYRNEYKDLLNSVKKKVGKFEANLWNSITGQLIFDDGNIRIEITDIPDLIHLLKWMRHKAWCEARLIDEREKIQAPDEIKNQ